MKKIFFTIALCCAVIGVSAQKEIIEKVIGFVGGEIVLLSELEEQLALMSEKREGKMPPDARCIILESLLSQKLLVNQAKLDSIEVTDDEVENQLDARISQILEYMNGDVKQFEDYYGQTITEVKEEFREDLRNQLLAERMRNSVMEGISVTPSEVKAFFKRIPRDSLPYFNSEVEVGEIVYRPPVNEEERQKAINKLEGLRKRIVEGGEDFAKLAQTFSDDFGSARIGGDLGWAKRGKFVPAFEAAAYNLEEGQISEPVESDFGFHLIQLIGRRGNSIHCRHILVKPEITSADLDLAKAKMDSVRQLLLDKKLTFSLAVKQFGFKDVQSFNNDGKMINGATGNTYFEIGDLEPDVYFTIDTMEVGSISNSFSYADPRGETYFRLVQLVSRSEPHLASIERDYSKIQQAAIEQKKSTYLIEWVTEKVESTYIKIDDYYKTCPNLIKWEEGKAKP